MQNALTVPATKLRDRRARLVVLQNADDLFVCKTVAFHSLVLSMSQSLLQNGLFQRGGKVRQNLHKHKIQFPSIMPGATIN
ncbi:hypothetical protein Q644_21890 [Brucella intermedia 229E]|uniref:Uncharacterized protein n=1 Tax=Brucella intermedia 229E TaxID=1337887 RepID=U4V9R5_9HYPH|nr:hypothetical protein Q644_21890 [Brucella intermedia 229E]